MPTEAEFAAIDRIQTARTLEYEQANDDFILKNDPDSIEAQAILNRRSAAAAAAKAEAQKQADEQAMENHRRQVELAEKQKHLQNALNERIENQQWILLRAL